MTQKVLKVGTSAAVTIPKGALDVLGIKIGDRVEVEVNRTAKSINISPVFGADSETVTWTKKFIERYRPALEALAKK